MGVDIAVWIARHHDDPNETLHETQLRNPHRELYKLLDCEGMEHTECSIILTQTRINEAIEACEAREDLGRELEFFKTMRDTYPTDGRALYVFLG